MNQQCAPYSPTTNNKKPLLLEQHYSTTEFTPLTSQLFTTIPTESTEFMTTRPQQQMHHHFMQLSNLHKPKRNQVKNACVNCQKACKKCDEGRPCQRCIKYNLIDTCQDSVRKERKKGVKRGPYKRVNSSRTTSITEKKSNGKNCSPQEWPINDVKHSSQPQPHSVHGSPSQAESTSVLPNNSEMKHVIPTSISSYQNSMSKYTANLQLQEQFNLHDSLIYSNDNNDGNHPISNFHYNNSVNNITLTAPSSLSNLNDSSSSIIMANGNNSHIPSPVMPQQHEYVNNIYNSFPIQNNIQLPNTDHIYGTPSDSPIQSSQNRDLGRVNFTNDSIPTWETPDHQFLHINY